MAAYRMTPARRAALKKAQRASARKRRGKGKGKLAAANRKVTRYRRTRNALIAAAAVGGAATLYSHSSTGRRHRSAIGDARLQQSYRPFESKRGFVNYARYSNRQFKATGLQNKAAIHGTKAIAARGFTRKSTGNLNRRFAKQAMYHTRQSTKYQRRAKKLRGF